MGTNRISEAATFALEMARAALPQIPGPYSLAGMWMHADMQTGNDRHRSVSLRIRIHGAASAINARCHVHKEGDEWTFGDCTVTLDDVPNQSWFFNCRRHGTMMEASLAQPAASPRPVS